MQALKIFLLALAALVLAGCSSLERKNSAPDTQYMQAQIPDWPNVRYLISTKAGVTAMVNDLVADQERLGRGVGSGKYLSLSGAATMVPLVQVYSWGGASGELDRTLISSQA